MMVRLRIILSVFLAFAGSLVFGRETRIEFYPATPGAVFDERLSGSIEGRRVGFEYYEVCHPDSSAKKHIASSRIRLAADGPVNVELQVNSKAIKQANLRTVGKDLGVTLAGPKLSFQLPGPGHYYLGLPEPAKSYATYTVFFWIDDLEKLNRTRVRPDGPDVTDVTVRGVTSDALKDQSRAIQAILDRGGTVYFPAGIYRTGTLQIGSNTVLYLAAGAMLKGTDNDTDFGDEFLKIENVQNVCIAGPGTIDANGKVVGGRNIHNVNITSSRNVVFEDVLFQNSKSWAVHIRKSDNFTARNVKVFSGKDGFDPDSSRDVLLENVFVVSIDDAVAVKNRYPEDTDGKTTERVTVRNAIVCSTKSALKIGTETRGPIRDITFENCDVFDGERGIVLYARDGGPIEKAVWRNIRMFMIDWPQEDNSGTAFHLTIEYRDGSKVPTPVRNSLIENVTANFIYRSELAGLPDAPLNGIEMRNIVVKVGRPKKGKPYLFECGDNVNLAIKGLTIDWQGNENKWAGIVSGPGLIVE
jgi:hypothetical protein